MSNGAMPRVPLLLLAGAIFFGLVTGAPRGASADFIPRTCQLYAASNAKASPEIKEIFKSIHFPFVKACAQRNSSPIYFALVEASAARPGLCHYLEHPLFRHFEHGNAIWTITPNEEEVAGLERPSELMLLSNKPCPRPDGAPYIFTQRLSEEEFLRLFELWNSVSVNWGTLYRAISAGSAIRDDKSLALFREAWTHSDKASKIPISINRQPFLPNDYEIRLNLERHPWILTIRAETNSIAIRDVSRPIE